MTKNDLHVCYLFCSHHEVISVGTFIVHECGQHLDALRHFRQVARDRVHGGADRVVICLVPLPGQGDLKIKRFEKLFLKEKSEKCSIVELRKCHIIMQNAHLHFKDVKI